MKIEEKFINARLRGENNAKIKRELGLSNQKQAQLWKEHKPNMFLRGYREIPKYPKYIINVDGVVRNRNTLRVIKPHFSGNKRTAYAHLSYYGTNVPIRKLLYESFIGEVPKGLKVTSTTKTGGMTPYYLSLVPQKDINSERRPRAKKVKYTDLSGNVLYFASVRETAEALHYSPGHISNVLNGTKMFKNGTIEYNLEELQYER